jgi:hypothetical protein
MPPRITRTAPRSARGPVASNGVPQTGGVFDRVRAVEFEDDTIQLLLYGRSGTGKTTLWSTFPKPILGVICSGGQRSGELRSVSLEDRRHIQTIRLENSQEFKDIVDALHENDGDGRRYRTIALDHAGGFQDLVLKEILGLDEIPVQKGWGYASREQYGACVLRCKEAFSKMLDLPLNVVIVAHERAFRPEEGAESEVIHPFVGAACTPSLTGWLNGAVDNVAQCYVRKKMAERTYRVGGKVTKRLEKTDENEFCLRTAQDDVYASRLRVPRGTVLPPVVVDPSYEKILALVQGQTGDG